MNWKAGLAALGGATAGGIAGWAIVHYGMKSRHPSEKTEGTGTLVGAALGMILGASIPTTSTTTSTSITKT